MNNVVCDLYLEDNLQQQCWEVFPYRCFCVSICNDSCHYFVHVMFVSRMSYFAHTVVVLVACLQLLHFGDSKRSSDINCGGNSP